MSQFSCPTIEVTAAHGVPFRLRLIGKGDRYGLQQCRTLEGRRAQVEFYDARYPHDFDCIGDPKAPENESAPALGQLVSRHYLHTLMDRWDPNGNGSEAPCLQLDGSIPAWRIDGATLIDALGRLLREDLDG